MPKIEGVAFFRSILAGGCILKIAKIDVPDAFTSLIDVEDAELAFKCSRVQISPAAIWWNFKF